MIGFFPIIYDDELIYSHLSRYYAKSGYLVYRSVAEDLFVYSTNKPSIEFCNSLTSDLLDNITQIMPLQEYILKHTMVNYYSAFLPWERQKQTFENVVGMDIKKLTNTLPLPKNRQTRYLRYCPLCVQEDIKNLNEAFYHRCHQLYGVSSCYLHNIKLKNSNIPITANGSPSLISLQELSLDYNIEYNNEIEWKIAKYATEILRYGSIQSLSSIGDFLSYKLQGTKYLSARGKQRNIKLLCNDFLKFYEGVDTLGFCEQWQIEKVFNNKRFNPYEICLLGLFLDIPANELCKRYIPEQQKNIHLKFDARIKELLNEGYNYRQISEIVGMSYDYCKSLVYKNSKSKNGKRKTSHTKSGAKPKNWAELDFKLLPQVKQILLNCQGTIDIRPTRITIGRISKELNISIYTLKRLPKSMQLINDNIETIEQYFAREIVWAYNNCLKDNTNITLTNICKRINIRKYQFINSLSYLPHFTDNKTVESISSIYKNNCKQI